MGRKMIVAVLAPVLLAGYAVAAVPDKVNRSAANRAESVTNAQVLAQAERPGLEGQEQQLLNQIQGDLSKLKADEAAEARGARHVNPQIRFIRASLMHLAQAASELQHTSKHYNGHRADALRAMVEAHNQLMQCYRIDSH